MYDFKFSQQVAGVRVTAPATTVYKEKNNLSVLTLAFFKVYQFTITVTLGTFHFLPFLHPHADIQAEHSYSLSEGDSAPHSPALSIKMDQESGGCLRLLFPLHLFCV